MPSIGMVRAADHVSQGGPAMMAATLPVCIWSIQNAVVVHLVRSPLISLLAMSMDRKKM